MNQRVAIVTGGAQGIGRGIAERLAQDGCAIAVWDQNADGAAEVAQALRDAGGPARSSEVDVSDSAQVRRALDGLLAEWGRVDILVNNAGWDRLMPFLDSGEDHWDRVIGVVYRGTLNTCRYVGPRIVEAEHGRIVNIGSDTAKIGGPFEAVYSGAKGAVTSFSRALARELAETGTTVNVVSPGSTDTPMFRRIEAELEVDPVFKSYFTEKLSESQAKRIPLGRLALPSDVANAVAFFASERTEFVTGQVLSTSGGETMY